MCFCFLNVSEYIFVKLRNVTHPQIEFMETFMAEKN